MPKLGELLRGLKDVGFSGDPEVAVTGIAYDSRMVKPGNLFVALPGFHSDGASFIPNAVQRGAVAIATQRPDAPVPDGTARLLVPDARRALADLSAAFYGYPARRLRVVGVTGTDGKTTTTYLVSAVLEAMGFKTGLITTVDVKVGSQFRSNETQHTTPEPVEVQGLLREMVDEGVDYAVLEASSHALALDRLLHCDFDVAVFTNLSPEHLNFHGSMEGYLRDKAKLFGLLDQAASKGMEKVAVLNADDPSSLRLREATRAGALWYGIEGSEGDAGTRGRGDAGKDALPPLPLGEAWTGQRAGPRGEGATGSAGVSPARPPVGARSPRPGAPGEDEGGETPPLPVCGQPRPGGEAVTRAAGVRPLPYPAPGGRPVAAGFSLRGPVEDPGLSPTGPRTLKGAATDWGRAPLGDQPPATQDQGGHAGPPLQDPGPRTQDSFVRASDVELLPGGSRFLLVTPQGSIWVESRLAGRFNVYNWLAAAAVGFSQGASLEQLREAIGSVEAVPGRVQRIDRGQPFTVVVDFAHTPQALATVLGTLRPVTPGKLFVLFGQAGERDPGNRSEMGRAAARIADFAIFTTDDPRFEDPLKIAEQVASGARSLGWREGEHYLKIADREEAIREAFRRARPGDTVLLAGKGHEKRQVIGDRLVPWNDAEAAVRILRALGYSVLPRH